MLILQHVAGVHPVGLEEEVAALGARGSLLRQAAADRVQTAVTAALALHTTLLESAPCTQPAVAVAARPHALLAQGVVLVWGALDQ